MEKGEFKGQSEVNEISKTNILKFIILLHLLPLLRHPWSRHPQVHYLLLPFFKFRWRYSFFNFIPFQSLVSMWVVVSVVYCSPRWLGVSEQWKLLYVLVRDDALFYGLLLWAFLMIWTEGFIIIPWENKHFGISYTPNFIQHQENVCPSTLLLLSLFLVVVLFHRLAFCRPVISVQWILLAVRFFWFLVGVLIFLYVFGYLSFLHVIQSSPRDPSSFSLLSTLRIIFLGFKNVLPQLRGFTPKAKFWLFWSRYSCQGW